MKGMILAAGLGTRLYPLTAFRAKPAVPFLNRPLIQYSWELLLRANLKDIVINSHHLPESIREAIKTMAGSDPESPQIVFSHEERVLGTGGAIGKVRDFLGDDTFVVCSGKIYFEQDLDPAIRFHQEQQCLVTLILVPCSNEDAYNPVFLDNQNNITGFGPEQNGRPFVFTGVHILDPQILEFIPEGPSETVNDIYPRLIREGRRVKGFLSEAYWCECSTPQNYLLKSLEVLKRKGLDNLTGNEIDSSCQGVIASPSVQVGGGCTLSNSILWDSVRVGANSSLSDVIVTEGVTLGPNTHLRGVVITPRSEKLESGTQVGRQAENYYVFPL
ncbi:NDP-sugar synthase [Acidobacteria bacterium AH-259-D05]|nr:NDP-sugar synthase [Acidobacteria bacterium AH-259-D05]